MKYRQRLGTVRPRFYADSMDLGTRDSLLFVLRMNQASLRINIRRGERKGKEIVK